MSARRRYAILFPERRVVMSSSTIGIILICIGAFAFAVGLLRPMAGTPVWRRWRILFGGPAVIVLGVLLVTGTIGGS